MTGNEQVINYLTSIPAWFLATCEDDQPHVRPFSFAAEENGKVWFCTASTKDVYRELVANPKFELSGWNPGHGWIVLRGKAAFGDVSNALRQEGYEHLVGIGEHYEGAADPELVFFAVDEPEGWICDIDGSWEPISF